MLVPSVLKIYPGSAPPARPGPSNSPASPVFPSAPERSRVDIETVTGFHHISDHQPDHERRRGSDLEVKQRLAAHTPDVLHVLHSGDAGNNGAEDDQRNDDRNSGG